MELATLNVSKDQARVAVREYRKAVSSHNRAEDRAILKGYNQIIKGRKLIELSKIIAAGGADERHRPRLAVIRADFQTCFVNARRDGSLTFSPHEWPSGRTPGVISFADGTMPSWTTGEWSVRAQGVVPMIPPRHRPSADIAGYHILWEAEWHDVPRDPALLKHLGGDLYAVVAVWDLTDLEMAVLAGRRR